MHYRYGNYYHILKGLIPYGDVRLFGSARKGLQFINNHDIDIGLVTKFKSKKFLKEKCIEVIAEYERLRIKSERLPLHFIIIGDFSSEFLNVWGSDMEHLLQFVPKKWKYLIWFQIYIKKFIQSQWKKF